MSKARKIFSSQKTDSANPYEGRLGLIYARVSGKRQELEGHGRESQTERCVSDLTSINVPVDKIFLDTYTGGGDFMNRPAMKELLAYVDANPHKKFVIDFDDLKRFARDTIFHLKLRSALKARDVLPRCLNYNFDDTPEGMFVETVLAAGNELERHQNKRQVVQKMKARLEAGYWTFGGKKGYTRDKDSEHGKIFRPNEEAKIFAEAAELFANRTLLRLIDVCHFLVEKEFWKKQSPEKYIDKLKHMFADPFYTGYIEYPMWEVKRVKGKHEAIISLETYERIQKILKKSDQVKRIRRNITPDFPLRGLLTCDHCGSHLHAAWTRKKFPYYICQNKTCPRYGKSIRRQVIEDKFVELLQKHTLKAEVGVLVEVVFERVWEQEVHSLKALEAAQARELKELEEKAIQLTEAILAAKSPQIKNIYEKQLEAVAAKIEEISVPALAEIDLSVPYRTALDKAVGLLKSPYTIWVTLEVHEQHRLFFFIFEEKLPYNQETGYRTDKIPSAVRLFEEFATTNSHDVEMGEIESPCRRLVR